MLKAARGRGIAPQSLPRFCHESNRIDLIETDAAGVRTRRITRFQLTSIAIGAIPNPSVSAEKPALRTLGGGGGVEAAGDEEHAESVVVVVAEAAGDAAGEFDEAVHGLGAAVG